MATGLTSVSGNTATFVLNESEDTVSSTEINKISENRNPDNNAALKETLETVFKTGITLGAPFLGQAAHAAVAVIAPSAASAAKPVIDGSVAMSVASAPFAAKASANYSVDKSREYTST